jgi:hypothetical protein
VTTLPRQCLVMLLALVVVGCAGRGGDGSRWVPESSTASVVAPSLEAVRGQLTTLLAGIEGASGVLDLLEARVGLDLRTREGLEASGVDPLASLSVFLHEGALVIALGVTSPKRFHDRVSRQVSRLGASSSELLDGPSGIAGVARAQSESTEWSLAWGTGADDVGVVLWVPDGGDADARWRSLATAPRGEGGRLQRAQEALKGQIGAHLMAQGTPSIPSAWGLGPAKMLLSPVISGLGEWDGIWVVEPTRIAWTVDGHWTSEGALAASWFQPAGELIPLADVLPKSQTLTLRARLNPAKVLAIPSFIRSRFLPERVPGPLRKVLPPVERLLTLLNGDVSVSLLGLDESATVEDALTRRDVAQLLQFVHVGVVVGVTDAEAARAAVAAARQHLSAAGWSPVPLEAGGWQGVALRSEALGSVWSVIYRDDLVAILSGAGEVARFVKVAEGTGTSLKAAAEGEVALAAASSPDVALGLSANFRRITRELAAKGLPPFFLKMVNDLRAISGTVTPRKDGVSLTFEVRL